MRRRLPSPALILAMAALFVALGGAGVAAGLELVTSVKPVVLVPASVSADGKVTGPGMTGGRVSAGVYTLTVRGDSFAARGVKIPVGSSVTPVLTISGSNFKSTPPTCGVSSQNLASNGSATLQVNCFAFDPATGWVPADTAFDIQVIGPGR